MVAADAATTAAGLAAVCGRPVAEVDPADAGATAGFGAAAHVTTGVSNVVEDSEGCGGGAAAEGAVPAREHAAPTPMTTATTVRRPRAAHLLSMNPEPPSPFDDYGRLALITIRRLPSNDT